MPTPAPIRWCNSAALTTCKATYDADSGYTHVEMPSPRVSTLTITSANGAVGGITVGGEQDPVGGRPIRRPTARPWPPSSPRPSTSARWYKTGNCTSNGVGYLAYSSGSVVTLFAPAATTATPVVTLASGTASIAATSFARPLSPISFFGSAGAAAVPGSVLPNDDHLDGRQLSLSRQRRQGADPHGLRRHHLHIHRGDDQLRELVGLSPHPDADDEDRGDPGVRHDRHGGEA
jgi:hypothetical protein